MENENSGDLILIFDFIYIIKRPGGGFLKHISDTKICYSRSFQNTDVNRPQYLYNIGTVRVAK